MTVPRMDWVQEVEEGFVVSIVVQPRSAKNEVVGVHAGSLKIKLTAPPVDGTANKALVKFLAKRWHLPASSVEILSGHTGRRKRILFRLPADAKLRSEWKNRLDALL